MIANQSVIKSLTAPKSVLKKQHNAIAYRCAGEAKGTGIIRFAWENGNANFADLLTVLMLSPRLRNWSDMCCGNQNKCHTTPFLSLRTTGKASGLCVDLSLCLVSCTHAQQPVHDIRAR